MLKRLLTTVFVSSIFTLFGQIVSQFEFDSNPVTNATIGPNATSISTSSYSSPGGVGGTNGLNAGNMPKQNINMVIPGSPTFDVPGIDVSFDFQRDENAGTFFERGQSLIMNGITNLSVRYRVDDGVGGFNVVNSGNIYNLPNDNTFRNYRFIYTPCDGIGMVLLDGVVIWSNDGPDNRDMYWVGAGNVQFGRGMDGNGANRTMVDNLIVGSVDCSPLPVDFLTITASYNENRRVNVNWNTTSETNNSHFIIERRNDFTDWDSIGTVQGAGNSSQSLSYEYIDEQPFSTISYYRIKQVDFDGQSSYSSIASVQAISQELRIYPNPSKGVFVVDQHSTDLEGKEYCVYNALGKLVIKEFISKSSTTLLDLTQEPEGVYFFKIGNETIRIIKN